MTNKTTVFIVDDDEAIRDSLKVLLEGEGIPVEVYASPQVFLETHGPGRQGCLLLDVRMPGMSGLELLSRLQSNGATIPAVFMTGHGDIPMAVEAMQRGAVDFLEKPFKMGHLLESIERALEIGERRQQEESMAAQARALMKTLTEREREVLDRLIQGQANKVIAIDLGISDRTVEAHRKNVMNKLQAKSLSQVVRLALQAREHPLGS